MITPLYIFRRCGEMVDAVDSKSTPSNRVLVRVLSSANKKLPLGEAFFLRIKGANSLAPVRDSK